MSDILKVLIQKAIGAVDALVDLALREPKPPHARGATRANDVMGPKALGNAVTGSVFPTLAMIVLALAFCVVLWLFAKIGLWPIIIVVWVSIGYFLWKNWNRFDIGRVKQALKEDGRRPEASEETPHDGPQAP